MIVHFWNWGWTQKEFKTRAAAEDFLFEQHQRAAINIHPAPYLTTKEGKRIYTNFELKLKLQEFIDFIDYHNKNLTKKQFHMIEELKEMLTN